MLTSLHLNIDARWRELWCLGTTQASCYHISDSWTSHALDPVVGSWPLQRSIRVGRASLRLLLTMTRSMFGVLLIHLLVCFPRGGADDNKPEQIHVGFTGIPSERIVNYVTPSPTLKPETVVAYGTSPNTLNKKATGNSFVFGTGGHNFTIHNVKVIKVHNERYQKFMLLRHRPAFISLC